MKVNKQVSFYPSLWTFLVLSKKPRPPVIWQMFCQKNNDNNDEKRLKKWKEHLKTTFSPCNSKFQIGQCEMIRQQVFFMYYAQWEAEPNVRAWIHPGVTLGLLSVVTFSCRSESMGYPWTFVHFYKCQPFNLQVYQMITLVKAPWQHVVQIHIEGKVALTFHSNQ